MVFERKHFYTDKGNPIGALGDVNGHISDGAYNNTNASGYINKKRIARRRRELGLDNNFGEVHHYDPPPEE